jgi:peptidoglycan/xylan/chitin deacetylase (PgdA/CDA1 family)
MTVLKHATKLRSLLPLRARERLYSLSPTRARRWQRYPGIERIDPGGHAVLTFDDGPDPLITPAVLDALDDIGARATFFLLGSQLHASPELGQEIVSRGHEIGLHGYGHERHDRIKPAESRDDVRRGFAVVSETLGVQCRWYRPPYGKMSDAAAEACRELGMTVVYWSAWGLDWEPVDSDRIAGVAAEQLDDGGILLLHDSARYAKRPSAQPTADALGMIAAQARARGISLVALRDALLAGEAVTT